MEIHVLKQQRLLTTKQSEMIIKGQLTCSHLNYLTCVWNKEDKNDKRQHCDR